MNDKPVDKDVITGAPARANRWRERLYAGRWVLIATAAVMAGFVYYGRLSVLEALLGFALIFLAALVVPRRARIILPQSGDMQRSPERADNSTQRFADALRDPCIIIDRRRNVVHINPAARRDFPSVQNDTPLAFAMRNPAFLSVVEKAVTGGATADGEFSVTVPTETWYGVTVAPLAFRAGSEAQAPDLFVISLTNQSEQRRLNQMRADFVANASHELRTPLTSLMGFLDTLMGPAANDPEAREKFLGIMRAQSERMARLIDDLLSLSRIELRQHMRPSGTVDLVSLVGEVTEQMQPQARDAEVELKATIAVDAAEITGDHNELVQVFENLIDNAMKYGGSGGVVEIILDRATDRRNAAFVVTVRDKGPGIAPENVPRLTERFYRVDVESSRRKKGTGLGLAIVKHIVNRHRGELSISSEPGKGTAVSVYLPA
ncbi:sensor histidine kinase [Cucumibacter marinus]|uniref:sensor histidine kinase n=1 Tax=Cucumibacter marinus TaxID=1121252 RepID=UPI00041BC682|nr:ATP-binding protein [Cucumibacter marinus]